jgi:F0F1-type ATP synthase assembly protein I
MTGQEPPRNPLGDDGQNQPDTGMGMTAVSYLLGGMLVWGGIGWLVDYFVGTKGIFAGIGAVIGIGGGVYLIVRRLGA